MCVQNPNANLCFPGGNSKCKTNTEEEEKKAPGVTPFCNQPQYHTHTNVRPSVVCHLDTEMRSRLSQSYLRSPTAETRLLALSLLFQRY